VRWKKTPNEKSENLKIFRLPKDSTLIFGNDAAKDQKSASRQEKDTRILQGGGPTEKFSGGRVFKFASFASGASPSAGMRVSRFPRRERELGPHTLRREQQAGCCLPVCSAVSFSHLLAETTNLPVGLSPPIGCDG